MPPLPKDSLSQDHSNISPAAPWGIQSVGFHFIWAYLLIPMIGSAAIFALWPSFEVSKPVVVYGLSLFTWGDIFCRRLVEHGWRAAKVLGLTFPGFSAFFAYSLLTALSSIVIGFAIGKLSEYFHWTVINPFSTGKYAHQIWLQIFAVTIAPLLEELIFRGYLQGTLYRYFAPWQAILITALGFTGLHGLYYGNIPALVYVSVLGLLLGWIRHRTQSVFPGMLGHLINNVMGLILK